MKSPRSRPPPGRDHPRRTDLGRADHQGSSEHVQHRDEPREARLQPDPQIGVVRDLTAELEVGAEVWKRIRLVEGVPETDSE